MNSDSVQCLYIVLQMEEDDKGWKRRADILFVQHRPGAVLHKQTQRLSPDDQNLPKKILEADGFFFRPALSISKKPAVLQAIRLENNRLLRIIG